MPKKKKAKVEFIPLIKKCTYHHKDGQGVCKNCNDNMRYTDGYTLIYTDRSGVRQAFFVDTLK